MDACFVFIQLLCLFFLCRGFVIAYLLSCRLKESALGDNQSIGLSYNNGKYIPLCARMFQALRGVLLAVG